MAINKDDLQQLIDQLPKDSYKKAAERLRELLIPEEEPTEEERKAIERGRRQIANGEYYTLDEFLNELDLDEDSDEISTTD